MNRERGGAALAKMRIDGALYELKNKYSDFVYPLSRLKWEEYLEENTNGKCFATDGITVYYFTKQVLIYSKTQLQYEIMHIVLHGLMGHFQIKDYYAEKWYRDFIMEIQVKYLLTKANIQSQHYNNNYRMNYIGNLLDNDYSMRQYYVLQKQKETSAELKVYEELYVVDNHRYWDKQEEENKRMQLAAFWGDIQQVVLGEKVNYEYVENELARMKVLEGIVGIGGSKTATEQKVFSVRETGRKEYRDLLKELFSIEEVCKEVPDTIDPMFYHYGLELYENIPLIEPMENCEKVVFRTLVIAIDVSASCIDKKTMECFWGETYRCISQLKEQYVSGQILLIQCDDRIEKEEWLELEDFKEIPMEIKVYGCGGTDFVPVFKRLAKLEEEGKVIDALL